ncbi:hypothetical protein [Chryseobacterium turcicum]|uniref:Uncharacterized protein n=1 Tax=Chryseobacterium turcicum TaxID=2898076 RepID=A0A9Q3V3U5_9FLAO|nr:hypothetical protein [Chryseobacterium turcicum]MCD1117466.1 hypothetical protein [Chryseobacterium turcicum]
MKTYLLLVFFFLSNTIFAQDRLSFVKDEKVKKEMLRSIEYFQKTIPLEVKNKIVFISFQFEELLEVENLSIYYSTNVLTQYAKLNNEGQFISSSQNKILYYNYSPNIIIVIENGFKYFDIYRLKELSEQIGISKNNLTKSEFFKYEKGNKYSADVVENFISLDKINNEFIPVRVNTFDLKSFMEIWYRLDVKEIPVSQT